ncbi:MAG TPA: YdcF family protein [Anaerolineales bacterium]|nr:YdcF family protein [Anaerolineales bacterium]
MFTLLSKILPILVYPASLAGILLLGAWWTRSRLARRRLVGVAVLVIWVLGNGWVASALVRSLEWRYLPQTDYASADAIVILGGATGPAEFPRVMPEIGDEGDRLLYGAALYKQGLAPVIIVTGGSLPWTDTTGSPADDMRELLVLMGVPETAIMTEAFSTNTYENAVFTRALAEPLGIDRILLVTSALHMPRSVPLFENQGFVVSPAPADYNVTRGPRERPLTETWPDLVISLFPNAGALSATAAVMKEYIGIGVYWLRGWY